MFGIEKLEAPSSRIKKRTKTFKKKDLQKPFYNKPSKNKHRRTKPRKNYKPENDNSKIKCWFCKKTDTQKTSVGRKRRRILS